MTTLRPAAVSMAIGVLTEATRVKEPCPRVDCPIANTYGKAAIRHLVLRIRTEITRVASVNTPIAIDTAAGRKVVINPGDIIVADWDGVVVISSTP
jgi:hypothetical protein